MTGLVIEWQKFRLKLILLRQRLYLCESQSMPFPYGEGHGKLYDEGGGSEVAIISDARRAEHRKRRERRCYGNGIPNGRAR